MHMKRKIHPNIQNQLVTEYSYIFAHLFEIVRDTFNIFFELEMCLLMRQWYHPSLRRRDVFLAWLWRVPLVLSFCGVFSCFVRAYILKGCVSLLRCWQQLVFGPCCHSLAWDSGYTYRLLNKHTDNMKWEILRRVTLPESSCERKLSHPKKSGDIVSTSRHCGKEHVFGASFILCGFCTTMKHRTRSEPLPKEFLDDGKVVSSVPLIWLTMSSWRTTQFCCEPVLSSNNDVNASWRRLLRISLSAQVSSSHLKLDERWVELASIVPMSIHFGEHNDHFMLRRAPQITRPKKILARNAYEKRGTTSKHTKMHGKHEQNTNWNDQKHKYCRLLIWLRYPFIAQRATHTCGCEDQWRALASVECQQPWKIRAFFFTFRQSLSPSETVFAQVSFE